MSRPRSNTRAIADRMVNRVESRLARQDEFDAMSPEEKRAHVKEKRASIRDWFDPNVRNYPEEPYLDKED